MAEAFFLQAGKGRNGNALKVLYQMVCTGSCWISGGRGTCDSLCLLKNTAPIVPTCACFNSRSELFRSCEGSIFCTLLQDATCMLG